MLKLPSRSMPLLSRLSAVALVAGLGSSAVLSLPLAALAQPEGQPGKTRPTQAQMAKIFPELRSLQLQDRRARIATLQSAERCIKAATSATGLQSCRKQERSAIMVQRQQHFTAMRQLLERNRLPVPAELRRGGRDSRPGAPGAGPGTPGAGLPL